MEVLHSYLRFDGKDSRDFGLSIEQPEITKKPKRKVNRISVPGRSGDYLDDEGAASLLTAQPCAPRTG